MEMEMEMEMERWKEWNGRRMFTDAMGGGNSAKQNKRAAGGEKRPNREKETGR